tara:strand:+ start:206 stop:379 length:174 start_codon:yes stop_codon:yes gene_type:complete
MTKKYSPGFLSHSNIKRKTIGKYPYVRSEIPFQYERDVGNTPLSKKVTLPMIKKLIK